MMILLLDFDSTFVQVEALDELARIVLNSNPDKEAITQEISAITALGMEGKITFPESLARRLVLFQPKKEHIAALIELLQQHITPSVERHKDFFQTHAENIYIISGGFKDYIVPVVAAFGIAPSHVLANTFVYDAAGDVTGYDTSNFLAQKGGKVKQVQALGLRGAIVMIGDGYTDYEVREAGMATIFIAFTENVARESVVSKADVVCSSMDEVLAVVDKFEK